MQRTSDGAFSFVRQVSHITGKEPPGVGVKNAVILAVDADLDTAVYVVHAGDMAVEPFLFECPNQGGFHGSQLRWGCLLGLVPQVVGIVDLRLPHFLSPPYRAVFDICFQLRLYTVSDSQALSLFFLLYLKCQSLSYFLPLPPTRGILAAGEGVK